MNNRRSTENGKDAGCRTAPSAPVDAAPSFAKTGTSMMTTANRSSSFSSSASTSVCWSLLGRGPNSTAGAPLLPPVAASDMPPLGQSLFYTIWKRDPAHPWLKSFYVGMTILGLIYLVFLPQVFLFLFPYIDTSWDDRFKTTSYMSLPLVLVEKTLNLPPEWVRAIFNATLGVFSSLIVLDWSLGNNSNNTPATWPYPKSWNTHNTLCYDDMFTEPTRMGRLIRRPGNTLSNASYMLCSLCVLSSILHDNFVKDIQNINDVIVDNPFRLADIEFGIMVFILLVASVLWHGSNAPLVQYIDLWSMDSSILYLLVRYSCMGGMSLLTNNPIGGLDQGSARTLAGWICAAIYTGIIATMGLFYWSLFQAGWVHGRCPFSARARILGVSDVFHQGHQDIFIGSAVCAFAILPVVYITVPTLIQLWTMNSFSGSVLCSLFTCRTLAIGWTYRLFERFALDGCVLMNYFTPSQSLSPSQSSSPSKSKKTQLACWQMVGAAIFSPTAVLHAMTGITLLSAYMHARSVDSLLPPPASE